MNPTWKKHALEFSARPKPKGRFCRNWIEYESRPRLEHDGSNSFDENGAPRLEMVEKQRWSFEAAMNWLRKNGKGLAAQACEQGWHMRLIGYVAYRHRIPTADHIEELILESQRIDRHQLPPSCYENRKRAKEYLLAPIQPQANRETNHG